MSGSQWVDPERLPGFINELHLAYEAGLVKFRLTDNVQPSSASYYLQQIREITLTTAGRDRAKGRVVFQPLPDVADDNGGKISDLIFRRIADAIEEQYIPADVATFLADEGIPPPPLELPGRPEECDAYAVLTNVWRLGSEGRRTIRRFVGRWLDDLLLIGPDVEVRALVIDQLARQGWSVREADSMLVTSDPVRGVPAAAPYLRSSRLHALIDAQAKPQFLIKKPDQAVFASMKAVEVRVRNLAGLTDQDFGVDLMNKAFGPNGLLTDRSAGRGEQDGTRQFFHGAFSVIRNKAGHLDVDYGDQSEAAEAVGTASLLMRILDRVEARLVQAGRTAALVSVSPNLRRPG